MTTSLLNDLHQAAVHCVHSMGDVFWDFVRERDTPLDFRDPYDIAIKTVEQILREAVGHALSISDNLAVLRAEYGNIVADLPNAQSDPAIIHVLVQKADWTEQGAQEVLRLARQYGTSILRNALALAEAMNIEDGDRGL